MVKIKPFKAIFYNQKLINDLSKVICPPYDIITPKERDRYYKTHPFNMINLILSKRKGKVDKYTNAKNILSDWLNRGILEKDEKECFYLYEQKYLWQGQKKKRVGFFCLLNLSGKEIFTHEQTRKAPILDRFQLLKSVQANLCPIFALFRDKKKILKQIYKNFHSKESPFIKILDRQGGSHRLWKIEDKNIKKRLIEALKDQKVFIADGHHRFQTALAYRDLKRKELKSFKGREGFNYILTYLTDSESDSLIVLPIHRAVKRSNKILRLLKIYFKIKAEKDKFTLFNSMKKLSSKSHILGMYKDRKFFSLHLKKKQLLDKIDVQILDSLFKESNLKDEDIIYSQQAERIIEVVERKEAEIGFFLKPLKIKQILEISLKKERLPLKSSYFYPKLPSGLLINKFKI